MKKVFVPEEFRHYYDDWHFSPAVETGELIFFAGVTAARKDKIISEDPEEQFHDLFHKLNIYLKSAGVGFEHIVEMTSYHIDVKQQFQLFSEVKDHYIKAPYPAWTAIGVSDFIPENALVEVRVIATRDI